MEPAVGGSQPSSLMATSSVGIQADGRLRGRLRMRLSGGVLQFVARSGASAALGANGHPAWPNVGNGPVSCRCRQSDACGALRTAGTDGARAEVRSARATAPTVTDTRSVKDRPA